MNTTTNPSDVNYEDELWRPLTRRADYSVSSYGRVRRDTPAAGTKVGHIVSVKKISSGEVRIQIGGHGTITVAELVLEAFVGPCPAGMSVVYLDRNQSNIRLDNLKWGDPDEGGPSWKPVVGYEDHYEVSDDGQVRRIGRVAGATVGRVLKQKRLKPWGHRSVQLQQYGEGRWLCVHRLVLEAHGGPCPDGMECRHLDGNSENNHVSNLKWGTHKENGQDMVRHGRSRKGHRRYNSKLVEEDVRTIRRLHLEGKSVKEIACSFPVSWQNIKHIVSNESWKHVK